MGQWMGCPYVFCSAAIEAEWYRTDPKRPGSERLMVPVHEIRHKLLLGVCPASGMWMPLDEAAQEALVQQAHVQGRVIQEHLRNPPEPMPKDRQARAGGVFPASSLYPRGEGKLPGRMGRQPNESESPDWNPPIRDGEEPQLKPPHVEGHQVGGRGMATVEQLMAQINDAKVKASEAMGALGQAKEALGVAISQVLEAENSFGNALGSVMEARDLVAATMENAQSGLLADMLGILQSAIDEHLTPGSGQFETMQTDIHSNNEHGDKASGKCAAAMEKGEQFIGNLSA